MKNKLVPEVHKIICSKCGIVIGEDRIDDIPIGTVFALKQDGFKENRVFCNQKEFDKFYSSHPFDSSFG